MPSSSTILIVEDNQFMARLLSERLKSEGFKVIIAKDGAEAIQKIIEAIPSLVIIDLLLPGTIDGFEVLRRLRASPEMVNLPVMVLTNLETKEVADKSRLLKAVYVAKAYTDTAEIIKKAKQMIRGEDLLPKAERIGEETRENLIAMKTYKARIEKALVGGDDLSIIALVHDLVSYGFFSRSSDIHINPEEEWIKIRLRIDGVMHSLFDFPKKIQSEIITRIKVLSGLRTDEHQAPQDGRFKIHIQNGKDIDVRVSIAPTYYGENCVMRVLADQAETFILENLGFSGDNLKAIYKAIYKPYGMILTTGPTGSGKTTTLYSILKKLNTNEVSIITIEDPVEYSLRGIDQVQVNPRTGLNFVSGLRFILRQDPDIIMVGEIRDDEAANIAVNAAMTGHLLLSTLHANDAATALPRLIDMKIEAFLIASTINIIISQRLVRMLCHDCKTGKKLSDIEFENLKEFVPPNLLKDRRAFFVGNGCDSCERTGYQGRIGIHEVLEIDEDIRNLVMKKANATEIREMAMKNGMKTILEDGFQKAADGVTAIEEVLRVFHE